MCGRNCTVYFYCYHVWSSLKDDNYSCVCVVCVSNSKKLWMLLWCDTRQGRRSEFGGEKNGVGRSVQASVVVVVVVVKTRWPSRRRFYLFCVWIRKLLGSKVK